MTETLTRTIVCPDGTQFVVNSDGTWRQEAWDGSLVRTDEDWLETHYEHEYQTDETRAKVRQEVINKLGLA